MHDSHPDTAITELLTELSGIDTSEKAAAGTAVYHVEGVGGHFYFAYEQLRNAAEYRERHLLMRGAIERFMTGNADLVAYQPAAAQLVAELTQAGYLANHSVRLDTIRDMDETATRYGKFLNQLMTAHEASAKSARRWMVQLLSVRLEGMLAPASRRSMPFVRFMNAHYNRHIDATTLAAGTSEAEQKVALACAVDRTILKSDPATTRYHIFSMRYDDLSQVPSADFIELNQSIDSLYQSSLVNHYGRLVNRYGAPMRILRELFVVQGLGASAVTNRESFLAKVRAACQQGYQTAAKTASDRLIKTIVFVFITKTLVGVAIEIPYDLVSRGAIIWQPLLINIVFPPLYMMLIGLQARVPGRQNTEVVVSYVDRIVYPGEQPALVYRPRRSGASSNLNRVFWFIYGLGFVLSFGLLVYVLYRLGFNIVNGLIFFIFFSAVSFLGFRLRRVAGELRMLPERENLLQVLVDFISTPFVRVGHWLSDRYAKANIVTRLLDAAIELPLKTSLRLVQQWVGFMRDKQDDL